MLFTTLLWIQAVAEKPAGFWNIDLGNLAVMLGLLLQGLLLYGNSTRQHGENKERIRELITWKNGHDLDAKQRDEAIVQLREIAAGMEATAESVAGQLQTMNEEIRDLRRRGFR